MDRTTFPMPAILAGKLLLKAQLGNDIRKIQIQDTDLTYDELLSVMRKLFSGKIKNSDEITIKYKDEDGDLITIIDGLDLTLARTLNRYIKIILLVNGKPQPLEHDQIKEIKNELLDVREKINNLLMRLDTFAEERSFQDQFHGSSQHNRSDQNTIGEHIGNYQKNQVNTAYKKLTHLSYENGSTYHAMPPERTWVTANPQFISTPSHIQNGSTFHNRSVPPLFVAHPFPQVSHDTAPFHAPLSHVEANTWRLAMDQYYNDQIGYTQKVPKAAVTKLSTPIKQCCRNRNKRERSCLNDKNNNNSLKTFESSSVNIHSPKNATEEESNVTRKNSQTEEIVTKDEKMTTDDTAILNGDAGEKEHEHPAVFVITHNNAK